ncbi:3'-5' exonuclease [Streptomyces prasinus]|uniref:3'-5' exonuclease n=1 Tax=Streptomyces prasinus TaxID=67345 RepID=UPI0006EB72EE|nr:3'-5' exonuclease [Streptomyces prasinus]
MWRLGDVRALRDVSGVGWEAARGLPKGVPSPLREYAKLAPIRAAVVRAFAQDLADRHGVTVWAWNSPYSCCWELDWERIEDAPKATVRRELTEDPEAGSCTDEIMLCPAWGKITREAGELLRPGRAAGVDTETTGLFGRTVEIAVFDAATGKKLMDTLVNPGDAEISDGARQVHGITDEMVVDTRPFGRILPRLRKVAKGRTICAYSAEYDSTVVLKDVERAGKKPTHLEPWDNWYCLMQAHADWLGARRRLRLGGGHRAAGGYEAARQVLLKISQGRGFEFSEGGS